MIPSSDSSVRVERGVVPLDELEALALVDSTAYTDVRTADANVRVWQDRAWVHVWPLPLGGLDEARAIVDEVFHGVRVEAQYQYGVLSVDVKSNDRRAAYRYFRRVCGPRDHIYASIMRPDREQLDRMPAFLEATRGHATFDPSLVPEVAAELTADLGCDHWSFDSDEYLPDTGVVQTYFVAPVKDADVEAWTTRIRTALNPG